jgi:hypothetical protein
LSEVSGAQISDGRISGNRGTGVYAPGGTANVTFVGVTSSDNGQAAQPGNDQYYRGFAFTEDCSDVRMIGCRADSNSECGFYSWIETSNFSLVGCSADGNNIGNHPGGHGFELNGRNVSLVGCESSGTHGTAPEQGSGFATGGSGVSYAGCSSWENHSSGFRSANGKDVTYSSCIAKNNSRENAGAADGFRVDVGSRNVVISGCHAFDDQESKSQGYGTRISGSVDDYVVTGNSLKGNLIGAVLDDGRSNKVIANNLLA